MRPGDLVVAVRSLLVRPSRPPPDGRPIGRLFEVRWGEHLVVLKSQPRETVEVLTLRGETGWIWESDLRPAEEA